MFDKKVDMINGARRTVVSTLKIDDFSNKYTCIASHLNTVPEKKQSGFYEEVVVWIDHGYNLLYYAFSGVVKNGFLSGLENYLPEIHMFKNLVMYEQWVISNKNYENLSYQIKGAIAQMEQKKLDNDLPKKNKKQQIKNKL
jgi:hypothetical protein